MYERPQLKRFGSLRELTEAGWDGDSDGWYLRIAPSVSGCNLYNSGRTCS
jgi:hypothetical protein